MKRREKSSEGRPRDREKIKGQKIDTGRQRGKTITDMEKKRRKR